MYRHGLRSAFRRHAPALILFPLLSFAWVGDTLFQGADLSAFDIILRLPHWKAEHEYRGVQQLILSDSPQAHYPERALKWRAVRSGERIDFNPFLFSGMPELSQGTGGFITSPFQLFMEVTEAIDWSTWLRLALAGLFMYAFMYTVGATKSASALAGILWAFSLHQITWLEFPQHLATQLWIPALLCFNQLILRRGVTSFSLMGILVTNTLFFTSGYIQIVLFTYVAIGIFNTVYLAADFRLTPGQRLHRWLTIHFVFVLSALVLVPKLAAELQFLDEGLRGRQLWRLYVPPVELSSSSLLLTAKNMLPDIGDYKRLFAANFFGGLWGDRYAGKSFYGNVVTGSIYTSVLIFALVPLSLLWLRSCFWRPLVLGSSAVLLFSFAMIHKDPLMITVFQLIPHSGHGGYERYGTIIVFFLAVLAATGAQVLQSVRSRSGLRLFWLVFFAAALSPVLIRQIDPGITLEKMTYPIAVLAALGTGTALLGLSGNWRRLHILLIVVAVIDLLIVTRGFNPRMSDDRNFTTTPTLEHLIRDRTTYRVAEVSRRQLYPPNILQWYGIPSISGYSTVAPARYTKFIARTIGAHHLTINGQLFLFESNLDVFRLLNVKYVLSSQRFEDERIELVRESRGYQLYELVDPLPRAYCATTLLEFDSESEVLSSIRDIVSRYDRPLALVGDGASMQALTPNCRVDDIQAYLNGISFEVFSDAPSYVFVPYNHYSHWKARSADGVVPVLKGNFNFVALPIEAGEHKIRLVYEDPVHLVFAATMLGLGIVVMIWFTRTRRRPLAAWLLAYAGIVLVLFSLLELPGIANTNLPERMDPPVSAHTNYRE